STLVVSSCVVAHQTSDLRFCQGGCQAASPFPRAERRCRNGSRRRVRRTRKESSVIHKLCVMAKLCGLVPMAARSWHEQDRKVADLRDVCVYRTVAPMVSSLRYLGGPL